MVVVLEVIVVTTTAATPWNFDTRAKVRRSLGAVLGALAVMCLKFGMRPCSAARGIELLRLVA